MYRMVCSSFHPFSLILCHLMPSVVQYNVFAVLKCSLLTCRAARWQSSLRASSIGKRRIMCSGVASYSCLQCDAKIGDMMQCSPSTLGGCKCDANKIGCCSFCHANWSDSDAFVIEKPERYDGTSVQPREGIPRSNTMLLHQPRTWMHLLLLECTNKD